MGKGGKGATEKDDLPHKAGQKQCDLGKDDGDGQDDHGHGDHAASKKNTESSTKLHPMSFISLSSVRVLAKHAFHFTL